MIATEQVNVNESSVDELLNQTSIDSVRSVDVSPAAKELARRNQKQVIAAAFFGALGTFALLLPGMVISEHVGETLAARFIADNGNSQATFEPVVISAQAE